MTRKKKGLYKVQYWPKKAPDKSKPYCVVNVKTGTINGRWHATRAQALDQMKAMYANMGDKAMSYSEEAVSMLLPLRKFSESGFRWIDGNKLWLQVYPYDTWDHPVWGETTINREVAEKMVHNFNEGVYGQEVSTDYEHGMDFAKGRKASGWYRKLEAREDALWGLVEFTENAKAEMEAGEWKYFSCSHFDTWTHPQKNESFEYVVCGGGLTNKPWVKGMIPLNFSEVMVERAPDEYVQYDSEGNEIERTAMPDEVTPSNESVEQEMSEPGTGSPPVPRRGDINEDDSANTGSRADPVPPARELDSSVDQRLREILGLDPDEDIIKAVEQIERREPYHQP